MTREIPLQRGLVALVDDEDYERVAAKKWIAGAATPPRKQVYARNFYWANGRNHSVLMHRFILDAPRGLFVDHIDGNGLNNTRANIRLCTHAENMRNQRVKGIKGVWRDKDTGRWKAKIRVAGKQFFLGCFDTQEQAGRAYDAAAPKYHGEFARPNFPSLAGAA